jgi:LPS-assembly protein
LFDRHASGKADDINRDNVANITRLDNTTYSTCNAGNSDWQLRADKIELDHDEGFGTARNVSVNFMGIPFFYSPWMTFPINDKRKSGLLTPSLGSSDRSGTEVVVPYYWNISPNRDATITPRILSKRGLQLNTEYRYLQENSAGQINLEALPSDNEYNDDRLLFGYKHQNRFAQRWSTDVNFNYVSDKSYFHDLGSDLAQSSSTHLERRLDLTYQGDSWNVLGRLHDFQTISSTAIDQYARLPQIVFNMNLPDNAFGIDYGLRAEAVAFDRDNSVTGTRFDIEPSISKPFRNNWGYVTPKLGVRHTAYNLTNNAIGSDDSPTRTTPIFSIDSGLFFERETSLGDTALIQTLEPRAYYLRIPKRNQDRLIVDPAGNDVVFDTGEYDFSFSQLFRENRFTGADRVNDADQLTLAVTSRLIDPASGIERASASLGQIFYFRDRDVTLPNTVAENDSSSAIVAELNARFSQAWSARAGIQYDQHDEQTDKGVFNVRYQPDTRRAVNLGFRRRRADIEQTDVSFSWPLSRQFNAVGRWNYSLDQDRTLDGFAGIEYESCCWIARLVAREYVNDLNDTDKNTAIMLQLELKGLTSFGDGVKTFLERGILGYGRDDPYNQP